MCSDWAVFSDYFGSQDLFCRAMDVLNAEGRFDAHASIPDEADMGVIDSSIKYLDKGITKYYDAHRAD